MLVLWSAAIFLRQSGKLHWIASVPAMFMAAVSISFIFQASIGFNLPSGLSNSAGLVTAIAALAVLLRFIPRPFISNPPSSRTSRSKAIGSPPAQE